MLLAKLVIINLIPIISVVCHPTPSLAMCHGLQSNVRYTYHYRTLMFLNNDDHRGKEPVSFGYEGKFSVQNVWQNERGYMLKINFANNQVGNYIDRKGSHLRTLGYGSSGSTFSPLFVHIEDSDDTQEFKSFYRDHHESITISNLKKAIAFMLKTKRSSEHNDPVRWTRKGLELAQSYSSTLQSNFTSPLMVPLVIDEWSITSQLNRDHSFVIKSKGWQNITFASRLYNNAFSKLYLQYSLDLDREETVSIDPLSAEKSLDKVITLLGEDYIEDKLPSQREYKTCHSCKSLQSLQREYEEHMKENEMASIPATIAHLKLMDRVRSGGPGSSTQDILKLLHDLKDHHDVLASLLDVLACARTETSIRAALKYLDLVNNQDLDISERFLATLSTSALAGAQSSSESFLSSLEFIVDELQNVIHIGNWKSMKLKLLAYTTLGAILRGYNTLSSDKNVLNDKRNLKFITLIREQLEKCEDSDCTISLMIALGNAANLRHGYDILEKFAINVKNKRESIFALRAFQDGLKFLSERCRQQQSKQLELSNEIQSDSYDCMMEILGKSLFDRMKAMIAQIIWEEKHDSTSRIIATEIVTLYLNDHTLVNSLWKDVENFENFEMTTLMYNRALRERRSTHNASNANWNIHSKLFNGSSASFKEHLLGTDTMNASYGITMELLTRGKLLKESSFDFEMHGKNSKPFHVLTVGLLATGLGSIAGVESDADEDTSAGLALKVLDVRLRPYTLFSGKGDLMGHVWSGTASEPMTAFSGNLLVSDYDDDGHRLINGFIMEQQLRGVLSLELTGQISISLWNRNSHSVVQARAALLVQGSQSIRTSDITTQISQRFAFGGSTSIDLVTDADFYRLPFKHCLQMEQPELNIRHNTRKYEQLGTEKVDARIHRRSYFIPAKSFAFHPDNNKMCAIMKSSS